MDLPGFVYPLLRVLRIPPLLRWRLARLVNTHFLLGAAAIVTDEAGRLLLFKHTYRRHYPWGLPGGWMQAGESPLEAVQREIYEESRLVVRPERLLLVGTSQDRPKLEFIVAARLIGGTFSATPEVNEHGWFAPHEYPPLATFHLSILENLAQQRGELGWYDAPWLS